MPKTLIKKSIKELPKNIPAAQKSFFEQFGLHISSNDVEQFDTDSYLDMVHSHWRLSQKRKFGEPKLSIHCPLKKNKKQSHTVIDVVSDDMAFLVDSVVAEINKNNLLIDFLIHPILYAKYDKKDKLKSITPKATTGYTKQSHIHIHIKGMVPDEVLSTLEEGLYEALEDVYVANRDWKSMLGKLEEARHELARSKIDRPAHEIGQYCAFLDYLHDNNFTLLGYRCYEFIESKSGIKSKIVKGESLGVLSEDIKPAYINENQERLPRNLQELRRNLPPVSVSKTNRLATVHRRVPMDAIAVKIYDKKGNVTGEKLFLGLFTSVTYSRSVSDVPFLREKVEDVMKISGYTGQSHDRKALRHVLEKYPRDELFQIPKTELLKICKNIVRLQERQRVALFIRQDPFGRYISCIVYIPRDRFGTELRKRIGQILEEELKGHISNFNTGLDDSLFARAMFMISVDQKKRPKYNVKEIEKLLQDASKTWRERLGDVLAEKMSDQQQAAELTFKYGTAFPINYTTHYKAHQCVFDIRKIEAALSHGGLELDLYRLESLADHQLRLKVYNPGHPLTLSDVMPILEHMGIRAISELPFEVKPAGEEQSVWIHDFLMETDHTGNGFGLKDVKTKFEDAFTKIWYGDMDSDALNKLVLSAAMNWDEIIILRTYVRYLKQMKYPFGRLYVEQTLTENHKIARHLIDLFKAYHNPKNKGNSEAVAYEAAVETDLEQVESLDQDRILRSLVSLVQATLRTNYYQKDERGQPKTYLALKLDCEQIHDLPEPKPYRETFVYSRRMEGVHLRGDKIARGGLRWSDRHEDFRTEILGLMKAQMVKNSVIVPMGAKGGFIVKKKITDRDEFFKEGVDCYKTLISGLLDLVDNRKGKKIIPPKNTVRRDGDDPYLVVAADKGTATFSDIANGLAQDYGFWLDDAFASGGSAGYDHKKMGITARGAWESVKLHFRQLNHDTQTQDFDAIGIGDMGGDVFGNGMLLSEHICLIGAFNHLHIFCDPNPDPKTSFKERQKLFDKVQGWDKYDTKKLSKGGRIYSRADKMLTLTPEIQARFDIEKSKVTPIELMNAILKARTDLLWFGGIGTYIRATHETDVDVGDKTNDAIRITAPEVRAKVIGEGANLGVTQDGRIEFSQEGGRINTDFIDNSGGVDSSDHEVNIKILLTDVMSQTRHKMDIKARNRLLERMTDEVADHVLRNNYQQAQALSLTEMQARENLKLHEEFIQDLEREHGLNREVENLPGAEEIERRLQAGKGLTRPELSILLSYAKITFTQDLLACDIPESLEMQDWLMNYFPGPIQKNYQKEIKRHRLAREIVATTMASSLVNRMGPTFLKSCMKKTGASSADVARAYLIVREAFGLRKLWDAIEALDNKVPAELQLKAMREIAELSEHAVTWFLTRLGRAPCLRQDIKDYGSGIATLRRAMNKLVTSDLKTNIKQRAESGERDGLPPTLAKQIAMLPALASACDIIQISLEQRPSLEQTAKTYFTLGEQFHFDWLRKQAHYLTTDNHWQSEATEGLVDQLYSCQAGLTVHVQNEGKSSKKDIIEKWLNKHDHQVGQLNTLLSELRSIGTVDLPMLVIAEQRLRNLYGG